jgi:hypothetical protein
LSLIFKPRSTRRNTKENEPQIVTDFHGFFVIPAKAGIHLSPPRTQRSLRKIKMNHGFSRIKKVFKATEEKENTEKKIKEVEPRIFADFFDRITGLT